MSVLTMHVPMLLSTCGPAGLLPDGVCGVIGGIGSLASDIAEAVQNPFRWFYHHTLGIPLPQSPSDPGYAACQQDWTSAQCPKLIDSLRPDSLPLESEWPRLYSVFAVSGMFIAATACVLRVMRALFDERVGGMHLVADAVMRLVVVGALLLAPSADHSLLLTLLTWMASAAATIAGGAAAAIAHAFNSTADLGSVVDNIAGTGFGVGGPGDFLVAIPVLLAALGFLYMVGLGLIRVIQLVFAVATAPLFVGIAAYDVHNRFVQWWLELLTSALVLPLALAICGSLTGAIALMVLGTHAGGLSAGGGVELEMRTIVACAAVLGGVWMTGKAVHGLAWRSFSHGGFTGAVTAVSASVLAVPTLATNVGGMVRSGQRLLGGAAGAATAPPRARHTLSPCVAAVPTADSLAFAASLHDEVRPAAVGDTGDGARRP